MTALDRYYALAYNYVCTIEQPDGSVILTTYDARDGTIERCRVMGLGTPQERLLEILPPDTLPPHITQRITQSIQNIPEGRNAPRRREP